LLSGMSVDELATAVAGRDLARLSSVQGIGKKTAERLVFELQDKFPRLRAAGSTVPAASRPSGLRADLLSALTNLGYKPAQAEKAAAGVEGLLAEGAGFEQVLREALRG